MSEFIHYLTEVFEEFGPVRARRMFGGYGLYHNDLMFGIIVDDVLYLKADDQSRNAFQDRKLEQFQYLKKGRPTKMSYYMAPDEIFDDPQEARNWATRAYAAAIRARNKSARSGNVGLAIK